MSMFNRIFGKPKEQANSNALATLDKLNEVTFFPFYSTVLDCFRMCVFIIFCNYGNLNIIIN
jgi:hypothetical protein